jgi:hypothetical protein
MRRFPTGSSMSGGPGGRIPIISTQSGLSGRAGGGVRRVSVESGRLRRAGERRNMP